MSSRHPRMCAISPLHPALPRLFDARLPNSPALWAVLEGKHGGHALVDNPQRPAHCLLRTDAALTYASLDAPQMFFDAAISRLRGTGPLWLVWPPTLNLQPPTEKVDAIPRRCFTQCDPGSPAIAALRARLMDGFTVQVLDRDLLERCLWRDEMAFYAGSLDNFLRHGLGLCLISGNDIIAEAYASAIGGGVAEIGAITHPAHRGRGYAPLLCAHLIDGCAQRGVATTWTCDAGNIASIRVAQKLGYQKETAYHILEMEPC